MHAGERRASLHISKCYEVVTQSWRLRPDIADSRYLSRRDAVGLCKVRLYYQVEVSQEPFKQYT